MIRITGSFPTSRKPRQSERANIVSGVTQADGIPRPETQTAERPVHMRGRAARQRLSATERRPRRMHLAVVARRTTEERVPYTRGWHLSTLALGTSAAQNDIARMRLTSSSGRAIIPPARTHAQRCPHVLRLTRTRSARARASLSETRPLCARVAPHAVPCAPAWHSAITLTLRRRTRVGPLLLSPRSRTPRPALSRPRTPVVWTTRNTRGT